MDVTGPDPVLAEAPELPPRDESSCKTSSSEDIQPGAVPHQKPSAMSSTKQRKKNATVSAVTEEARKVLEQFLKQSLSHSEASYQDGSEESPYAMLTLQPEGPLQYPNKPTAMGEDDEDAKNDFTDYEKIDDSPDYAECYDITDGPELPMATCSMSSQSSFGVSLRGLEGRSHSPCERALHAVHPVDRIAHSSHAPKVKSRLRGKAKRRALFDSDSSSSTEDYEYPDIELLARKKKSFFKWASERLRQSFRREDKKGLSHIRIRSAEILDSPRDFESPPPLPTPKSRKKSKFKLSLKRSGSEKSKSTSISPPNQEVHSDTGEVQEEILVASRCIDVEVPPDSDSAKKGKKSPLPWRRHDPGTSSRDRDNRSLFDSFLHHIRKGSQKLKRKGSKGKRRRSLWE